MKDREQYITELKAFFSEGNFDTWLREIGRYNFAGAMNYLEEEEVDALVKKYPLFLAAAVSFGRPAGDFRIADSALEIDQLKENLKNAFNNIVKGWNHLKAMSSDQIGFTDNRNFGDDKKLLSRCERLLTACMKAKGVDLPAHVHEFELDDALTAEQVDEMRTFFAAEKLEDVLGKSEEALAAEAEAAELVKLAEAALTIWTNIEPKLDEFDEVAEQEVGDFENSEALREYYLPYLEKLHAYRDNEFEQVKEFIALAEKEHGGCGGLTEKLWKHHVGSQEQHDAIVYLKKSVDRFSDYCLQLAKNFEHEAFLMYEVAIRQNKDNVERRVELFQFIEDLGNLALAFNPESENGKKYATEMADRIAKEQADHASAVKNAVWHDTYKHFKGPGDAVELAKLALQHYQECQTEAERKLGARFFAASVENDWFVGKRNWLGEPIQYRIPCWIAGTVPGQPGIARVWKVDFCAHFVKPEPPFKGTATMNWSAYRIPIEKIEKAATVLDKDALKEGKKIAQRH